MIWCVRQATIEAEATGVLCKNAKVFDANGVEIRGVRWMNTETGEVERLAFDENGKVMLKTNGEKGKGVELTIVCCFHPAPLSVVEIEEPAS